MKAMSWGHSISGTTSPDIVLEPANTTLSAAPHPLKDDPAGLDDPSWETMWPSTDSCYSTCTE